MLTDEACNAIRHAIGKPDMSCAAVRAMVAAINGMPDGLVWVVPRDLGNEPALFVEWLSEGRDPFMFPRIGDLTPDDIEWAKTAAGAAEMGEG